MCCLVRLQLLTAIMVVASGVAALAQGPTYHLGRTPSAEESRACCIPITPDGKGLPPGSGTAKQGAPIFAQRCAGCHGPTGAEGPWNPLVGKEKRKGQEAEKWEVADPRESRGIGERLYATTVWDYINRYMPLMTLKRTDWKSGRALTADEVYALTAFLLYRAGLLGENDLMDAQSLPKVRMPSRARYVPQQPDWTLP